MFGGSVKVRQSLPTIVEDSEWSENVSTDYGSGIESLDESDSGGSTSASQTLVLFDWDDSLLPTTWLAQEGLLEGSTTRLTRCQQTLLQELEVCIEGTLLTAMTHGRVVIVTNAAAGWVEDSCSNFLPGLRPMLDDLDIISARSAYEDEVACPSQWKRLAFEDVIYAHFGEWPASEWRNVVSIGDSTYEQNAVVAATAALPSCHSKSLKLMERPRIEQLIDEHRLLGEQLTEALLHEAGLDLEVGVES